MPAIALAELFREEFAAGLRVFAGGRERVETEDIATDEVSAIRRAFEDTISLITRVSPKIAETLRTQESFFIKAGQIAKASLPVPKPIRYPAEPGTIGVSPLIPQAIRYVATPTPSTPAYSNYELNSWVLPQTAGVPVYLLGSPTDYYKACPIENKRCLLAIAKDGLIEISQTTKPGLQQLHVETEIQKRYGPWAVHPLVTETIEDDRVIYQYNTIGPMIVYRDLGTRLSAMPARTQSSEVKMLGMFFYEYEFWPTLLWIV